MCRGHQKKSLFRLRSALHLKKFGGLDGRGRVAKKIVRPDIFPKSVRASGSASGIAYDYDPSMDDVGVGRYGSGMVDQAAARHRGGKARLLQSIISH